MFVQINKFLSVEKKTITNNKNINKKLGSLYVQQMTKTKMINLFNKELTDKKHLSITD